MATWWDTPAFTPLSKKLWHVLINVWKSRGSCQKHNYGTIIIADHGNADHAINADGSPNTAHSLNPVPFIYVSSDKNASVKNGRLADVAPSLLHIMGLPKPKEMTGEDLITD